MSLVNALDIERPKRVDKRKDRGGNRHSIEYKANRSQIGRYSDRTKSELTLQNERVRSKLNRDKKRLKNAKLNCLV